MQQFPLRMQYRPLDCRGTLTCPAMTVPGWVADKVIEEGFVVEELTRGDDEFDESIGTADLSDAFEPCLDRFVDTAEQMHPCIALMVH